MRESWDNCGDDARRDRRAHPYRPCRQRRGLDHGRGELSGLVAGHVAGLQELGVGLALGVLLDATIVRGLLMPSLMALFGRWNWWLPSAHRPPCRCESLAPRWAPEARPADERVASGYFTTVIASLNAGR